MHVGCVSIDEAYEPVRWIADSERLNVNSVGMIIFFVETERDEEMFFKESLPWHALHFVSSLDEVDPSAEVVSGFIYSHITAEFLEAHPNLRLIATRSTGYDHIDVSECQQRNVAVCVVPSYGDNTVAEHTFALILALSRRLREAMEANKTIPFSYESVRGFELKNKTLGVVGAGRIGLHTIRIAKAFGMQVVAYDVNPQPFIAEVLGFEYVTLDQLYARSDIISLHIPLIERTYHLLNRESFAKCKRGVIVINTARGALIETEALIEMLDNGVVRGAGLDVLEEERVLQKETMEIIGEQILSRLQSGLPPGEVRDSRPERIGELQRLMRNTELIGRLNVVFTPHIAFNCVEAVERINNSTVRNIEAFAAGEPVNLVTGEK